jgi:hypothetical protein
MLVFVGGIRFLSVDGVFFFPNVHLAFRFFLSQSAIDRLCSCHWFFSSAVLRRLTRESRAGVYSGKLKTLLLPPLPGASTSIPSVQLRLEPGNRSRARATTSLPDTAGGAGSAAAGRSPSPFSTYAPAAGVAAAALCAAAPSAPSHPCRTCKGRPTSSGPCWPRLRAGAGAQSLSGVRWSPFSPRVAGSLWEQRSDARIAGPLLTGRCRAAGHICALLVWSSDTEAGTAHVQQTEPRGSLMHALLTSTTRTAASTPTAQAGSW